MAEYTKYLSGGIDSNHYYSKLVVNESQVDTANNRSYVTATLYLRSDNGSYEFHGYNNTGQIWYSGSAIAEGSTTNSVNAWGDTQICSWSGWVSHNSDGSKTMVIGWNVSSAYAGSSGNEISFTLTKINRGFSTRPTLNVIGRKPHSLTYRWMTSEYCSKIVVTIGTSSLEVFSGKSQMGQFVIDNLTPNTSYTVTGVFTREDTGGTSSSLPVTASTKKIAARIKVNGEWKEAMPYVRVSGVWKEAIPHIRVNNQWKEGI